MAANALAAVRARSEGLRQLRAVVQSSVRGPSYDFWVGPATRLALEFGDLDLADAAIAGPFGDNRVAAVSRRSAAAMIAESRGCLRRCRCRVPGGGGRTGLVSVFEAASAFLGAGRCLVGAGRPGDAATALASAREIFTLLGAGPSLATVAALEGSIADAVR